MTEVPVLFVDKNTTILVFRDYFKYHWQVRLSGIRDDLPGNYLGASARRC